MTTNNDSETIKKLLHLPLIVDLGNGEYLKYKEIKIGYYDLFEENLKTFPNSPLETLVFTYWDSSVINCRKRARSEKMSDSLQWKDVTLAPTFIKAKSFDSIIKAFAHIKIEAVDTDDAYAALGLSLLGLK